MYFDCWVWGWGGCPYVITRQAWVQYPTPQKDIRQRNSRTGWHIEEQALIMSNDNLLLAHSNYGCILLTTSALSSVWLLISMYLKLHGQKIVCLYVFLSLTHGVCLSSLPAKNRKWQRWFWPVPITSASVAHFNLGSITYIFSAIETIRIGLFCLVLHYFTLLNLEISALWASF